MEFTKRFSTRDIGRINNIHSAVAGPSAIAYKPPFFGASKVFDTKGSIDPRASSFRVRNAGSNKSTLYVKTSSRNLEAEWIADKTRGRKVPFVENIDLNFRMSVTRTKLSDGRHKATVIVVGGHDDFPWYEAYLNGKRVYTYVTPFSRSPLKGIISGLGGDLVRMKAITETVVCPC